MKIPLEIVKYYKSSTACTLIERQRQKASVSGDTIWDLSGKSQTGTLKCAFEF